MIPRAYIDNWRANAPWSADAQVEQDLVIMRMLVMIFSDDELRDSLAFRGGTALHKLYLAPAVRYSEDLDLVQRNAGSIGPLVDRIRYVLDPVFGEPRRQQGDTMFTMYYRFQTEIEPVINARVKLEINGREHHSMAGYRTVSQSVVSPWFNATCDVTTYSVEELLGTKLRALYQRRKGRDLFDIYHAHHLLHPDPAEIVKAFLFYVKAQGLEIRRSEFEANLAEKLQVVGFRSDMEPLLRPGTEYDIEKAFELVTNQYLALLD